MLRTCIAVALSAVCASAYTAPVPEGALYFENFQSGFGKWIVSENSDFTGTWKVEHLEGATGFAEEQGLIVGNEAKKHAISTKFDSAIDPKDGLVVQYEVRFHNDLQCGGAYLKLIRQTDEEFEPSKFSNDDAYTIMFGPDACGTTNKVHFIFQHKNPITGKYEEKHLKNPPRIVNDRVTHLYTLIIRADDTYEILIDNDSKSKGSLLEDFDPAVNPPKEIDDPEDKKPADWVDEAMIKDPEAVKPEDWDEEAPMMIPDDSAEKPEEWLDDEPEQIPDPEAEMPDDWDEELDGEWDAPLIDNPKCEETGCGEWTRPTIPNPAYKGKWTAPMIENPDYIGVWSPKKIPNPDFFEDLNPHLMTPISGVGIEIWTMQNNIEFDNIYIGTDEEAAKKFGEESWKVKMAEQEKEAEAESEEEEKIEAVHDEL